MKHSDQHTDYWLTLIIDYLTGTISDLSKKELEGWIDESAGNKTQFLEYKKVWDSMEIMKYEDKFDANKAFQSFLRRKKRKKINFRSLLSRAAMVAVVATLGYFTLAYFKEAGRDKNYIAKAEVPLGSKAYLELKDSTCIWLNAGSTLDVDDNFGIEARRLRIYGEAFLEVAKNKDIPLIVEAQDLMIKVYGTTFNINSYKENDEVKVALIEGSIGIFTNSGDSLLMYPSDLMTYNVASKTMSVKKNGIKNSMGWKNNQLLFDGETFKQIAHVLERTFNVQIHIHNQSLENRHFVGDFAGNETIEEIIDIMSTNQNFTYKIQGTRIDIY